MRWWALRRRREIQGTLLMTVLDVDVNVKVEHPE